MKIFVSFMVVGYLRIKYKVQQLIMEGDQYERDSECQDYADYGQEGYLSNNLCEKFKNTYTVVQKLGWGHFSTVWLALKDNTKQYLALKIQRSKQTHTESAIDELEMLTELRRHQEDPEWIAYLKQLEQLHPKELNIKLCRPLLLIDSFPHYGIHGKHMCSVFELMGPNLLDVIQHYEYKEKRMPLWLVKKITRDVLMGLVYLHQRCKIIHTDLKPENIMIKMEEFEQKQLIEQLCAYKVKPISMKYLKNIQTSKNPKNKKKQQKKKLKKKKLQSQNTQNNTQNKQQAQEQEDFVIQQNSSIPSQNQTPEFSMNSISNSNPSQSSKSKQIPQRQFEDDQFTNIQDGIDMSILTWKNVKIKLNDKLFFKIADLGNACFSYKHFTEDIQTREYRSPQVLIGHDYYSNTDIFSLACTVYEMMTNNFLFKPKKISGIKKDQDHMFQMLTALGPIDKDFATTGKYSAELFNKKGKLINGSPKDLIPISRTLIQEYGYQVQAAVQAERFLLPMLAYEPKNRIDARTCLQSTWLWS